MTAKDRLAELTQNARKPDPRLCDSRPIWAIREPPVARSWRWEAIAGLPLPAIEVVGAEVLKLRKPGCGMLFSKGKREDRPASEGRGRAARAELVLVDGPVTPVQQRNLEKEWGVNSGPDRADPEIFADRAQTREGLQVELAALAYQRTRLVRAWTHL